MADETQELKYRDFLQQYAQGGIKTAILINGGAAVAVVSKFPELMDRHLSGVSAAAMIIWAIGITAGAMTWWAGVESTLNWGNSQRDNQTSSRDASNRYLKLGRATLGTSVAAFIVGCMVLAVGVVTRCAS